MIWIIIDTALVILSLGMGVGSILIAMRINLKYGFNYLNSLMYYQILLFIFGLYGLLGTIIVRNVLVDFEIPISTIKSMAEFIPYIGVPVILTAWFMFLKMSFEIVGKTMSRIGGFLYFGTIVLSLLGYVVVIVATTIKGANDVDLIVNYAKFGFFSLELITMVIAYFILYRFGITIKHIHKRKLVLWFATVSLVASIITMVVFLITNPDTIMEKVYLVLFFAGSLPAVCFLAYYLNLHFSPVENSRKDVFVGFVSDYKLSKRESEIVKQICKGLTNAQISNVLFISVQTVKDHVYHIYKKTGVRNRVQLVNMVGSL